MMDSGKHRSPHRRLALAKLQWNPISVTHVYPWAKEAKFSKRLVLVVEANV